MGHGDNIAPGMLCRQAHDCRGGARYKVGEAFAAGCADKRRCAPVFLCGFVPHIAEFFAGHSLPIAEALLTECRFKDWFRQVQPRRADRISGLYRTLQIAAHQDGIGGKQGGEGLEGFDVGTIGIEVALAVNCFCAVVDGGVAYPPPGG